MSNTMSAEEVEAMAVKAARNSWNHQLRTITQKLADVYTTAFKAGLAYARSHSKREAEAWTAENELKLQIAVEALDRYADESMWYTPNVCDHVLHKHSGHICQKNWAFLYRWGGYDIATEALAKIKNTPPEDAEMEGN